MMRPPIPRDIRHELMLVTGEEVDVPLEGGAELTIVLLRHPEVPEIKNPKIQRGVRPDPAKPWAIVLRGMRQYDGQAWRGFGVAHSGLKRIRKATGAPITTMAEKHN